MKTPSDVERLDAEHLAQALEAWAQNEEMIDAAFLEHGADCLEAARVLRSVAFLRRIMARMVQTS